VKEPTAPKPRIVTLNSFVFSLGDFRFAFDGHSASVNAPVNVPAPSPERIITRDREWFTVEEACEYLRQGKSWLYDQIAHAGLPAHGPKGNQRFFRRELDAWVMSTDEKKGPAWVDETLEALARKPKESKPLHIKANKSKMKDGSQSSDGGLDGQDGQGTTNQPQDPKDARDGAPGPEAEAGPLRD